MRGSARFHHCFAIFSIAFVFASACEDADPDKAPALRIVLRTEWGAQPPARPPNPAKTIPPPYVIISHTVSPFCYDKDACSRNVRQIQSYHLESRHFDDIAYGFLIGGDGLVYEGRGWLVQGAHTYGYNSRSIGISFIGNFNDEAPTEAQLVAAKKLIEYGVEAGRISGDYKLLGHRQCVATISPGDVLYGIIKTWDHWSPKP